MKRAYLVIGPESSGNRHLTRLLVEAGCAVDTDDVRRLWEGADYSIAIAEPRPEKVVACRTLPHAGRWLVPLNLIAQLESQGYLVTTLTVIRDQRIACLSAVANQHVATTRKAMQQLRLAMYHIATIISAGHDSYLIPYNSLGKHEYRQWLACELGLASLESPAWVDGDPKYATSDVACPS